MSGGLTNQQVKDVVMTTLWEALGAQINQSTTAAPPAAAAAAAVVPPETPITAPSSSSSSSSSTTIPTAESKLVRQMKFLDDAHAKYPNIPEHQRKPLIEHAFKKEFGLKAAKRAFGEITSPSMTATSTDTLTPPPSSAEEGGEKQKKPRTSSSVPVPAQTLAQTPAKTLKDSFKSRLSQAASDLPPPEGVSSE